MQSLLRWGIENSVPQQQQQQEPSGSTAITVAGETSTSGNTVTSTTSVPQPKKWDPELVQALLGRPDSELMKDALKIACDESKDEDARLTALDDFEMLVEQIDNANDIEKLGMWKPLQQLLISPQSSDEIRSNVLWIIGTAVQNNPPAQKAYLHQLESPLASVLAYLSPSETSPATRSKAIYALSGLLKHNAEGVRELSAGGGWNILKLSLEDPDIRVRRKTVFLLSTLLLPAQSASESSSAPSAQLHGPGIPPTGGNSTAPVHPNSHAGMTVESADTATETARALHEHEFLPELVKALVTPLPHGPDGDVEGDEDLEEKLVRLLFLYLTSARGKLDDAETIEFREWLRGKLGEGKHWELAPSEIESLQKALSS